MAEGVELATAWVRLVPSAQGVQGEVAKAFAPAGAEAEKAGKKAGGKFSTGAKTAMLAGAAVVAAGVVKIFNTGLEELKFGEQINAQTDILIKNTGFTGSTQQINDYTLALSKVSGVSEEELQSAGNQVLKFGAISEENYQKAVSSINDLAASGKDAEGAGVALGKALADPATAASLLRRQGIALTEQQQEQIKAFTEAGDKASAQGVILDALEGTYGGMAEAAGGTLEGNLNKLNNAFENMSGDLVESLMPAIMGIVEVLQGLVGWISENQGAVAAIAIAIGVTLVAAFIAWAASIWATTVALLANPITWIILAIIALIAAVVALVLNWDAVVAWIVEVWSGFISWITGVIDAFVIWWNGIWTAVGQWISDVWSTMVTAVTGFFTDLWNGIKGIGDAISTWWNELWQGVGDFIADVWRNIQLGVQAAIGVVRTTVETVLNTIKGIWEGIWEGIFSFVSDVWTNVTTFVGDAIDGIFTVIDDVLKNISRVWEDMWQGAVDFLGDVFGGIVAVAKGPINGIISLVNGAIRALNSLSITIPGWVPLIGGQTWSLSLPTLPMLAQGGTITRGGAVIVGERGPELLNLPAGASVDPDISGRGETFVLQAHIVPERGRPVADQLFDAARRLRARTGAVQTRTEVIV